MLWDNYPVNDLSMRDELHLGPLQGRDPKLPRAVYGYLSNPLLQEKLSFIPLATCFDYAADPIHYQPESSWKKIVCELFGAEVAAALARAAEILRRTPTRQKNKALIAFNTRPSAKNCNCR